jgi:hypothetical protein
MATGHQGVVNETTMTSRRPADIGFFDPKLVEPHSTGDVVTVGTNTLENVYIDLLSYIFGDESIRLKHMTH